MVRITGKKCTWCNKAQIDTNNSYEGFCAWLKQGSACCAPDGDGHLWIPMRPDELKEYPVLYNDGEPCEPACIHHITHPCEKCGRTAARGIIYTTKPEPIFR